ncbi:type II toxin-antitoxin system prevent-host-death family antitoxin [Kyrpidia spormannii]|uniref:type II toxin-antitoxin system prevent-host-death family antitoxin n=1 Tax=Kyrpidia spormannii TaxID=2055160 RepID=UPI001E3E37A2|nr:type II toxin-antitoxin system prevent-host-death family antitoxin [Kyrpidia spormannii]
MISPPVINVAVISSYQDAKNRLSELVHKAMRNGPQMITVRGKTGGRRGVHLGI